ncbi:phage virion morphogenesis protein [Thalassobius sp. S69A]|uniref:phage virion morphogenesis protein n=1 Tax=unclassified Thalassovita TaxID=2619711 RepID=UPI003C7BABBC
MIPISTTLAEQGARNELQDILQRLGDPQGFYATVGERLISSSKDRFREENAPDGTPWEPLKPATIKARQNAGQTPITILRSNSKGKSGSALAGSLSYLASSDEVRIGSPLPYAAIHQFGGQIRIPERQGEIYRADNGAGQPGRRFVRKSEAAHVTKVTIPAHVIRIPARPFVGLTEGDEQGILEDARDWLSL